MKYVIGVDAGGSHTEAAVSNLGLSTIVRARGGPGNLTPDSIQGAVTAITSAVDEARDSSEFRGTAWAAVVGAAGSGSASLRDELIQRLDSTGIARTIHVVSDVEIALEGAFPDQPGILLAAGTGSIALARDTDGAMYRVGGYGPRLGDEGSGHAIAREGLGAALRSRDGRLPPTRLLEDLDAHLRRHRGRDLESFARDATVESIADLCPVVLAAADAGDQTAQEIVERAVSALVAHVAALRPKLPAKEVIPVAFLGGVLSPGSRVRFRVEHELASTVSGTTPVGAPVDPVLGALRLAVRRSTAI